MKNLIIATAVAVVVGQGSAIAADMAPRTYTKVPPIQSVYNWTGLYAGVHIGAAWGRSIFSDPATPGFSLNNKFNGVLGGAQVGYNIQTGPWVFGVEADISGSGVSGRTIDQVFVGDIYRTRIDWMATLTGRVGFAMDRTLFYAKGGGALMEARYEYTPISFGDNTLTSASATRGGYTVGGGVEYGMTPNWTARLEYSYVDFGRIGNVTLQPIASGFVATIDTNMHVVKAAANYRF